MSFDAPLYDPRLIARKSQLVNILERLCESLELSAAQYELAKKRYEGVGKWLAAADDPLLRTLSILAATEGLDQLSKTLRGVFGQAPVSKAMDSLTNEVSGARTDGRIGIAPGIGLTIGAPGATAVRPNTFFGARMKLCDTTAPVR
jgi:hypothetical protein